jgi:hypothetical protein
MLRFEHLQSFSVRISNSSRTGTPTECSLSAAWGSLMHQPNIRFTIPQPASLQSRPFDTGDKSLEFGVCMTSYEASRAALLLSHSCGDFGTHWVQKACDHDFRVAKIHELRCQARD